jgi:peroxiredoxin
MAVTVSLGIVMLVTIGFRALQNSSDRSAGADAGPQMKIAPDFSLKSVGGRSLRLSDYRGKIVLVNFWATWCAPCRVEMPSLVALYEKYHGQGVEIIGVSMDDGGQERVAKFAGEMKINYPILFGNQSVADGYGGLRLLPQTVLVTPDGRIFQTMIGMREKKDFESAIEQLLAMQPRK